MGHGIYHLKLHVRVVVVAEGSLFTAPLWFALFEESCQPFLKVGGLTNTRTGFNGQLGFLIQSLFRKF